MTWPRTLVVASLLAAVAAGPVQAQAADDPSLEVDVEVGLDGWINGVDPVPLEITVRSDLLFVGEIRIATAGSPVLVKAEVPAGGTKTYQLLLSGLLADRNLRIELVPDGATEPAESLTIRPELADDEVLVAANEIGKALDLPATTEIGDRPIELIQLPQAESDPGPAHYFLVDGVTSLSDGQRRWLARGGTLVVEDEDLEQLARNEQLLSDPLRPDRLTLGTGNVLVVGDFQMTAEEWQGLLRGRASRVEVDDPWSSSETSMLQAAGASRSEGLARPGPLIALGIYALVVAPVNLLVLKRMGRREWAWFTVPAISILTAVTFWVAANFSINDTQFAQATVVVGSPGASHALTALLVAADAGRFHQVSVDERSLLYPAASLNVVGVGGPNSRRVIVDSHTLEFVFDQASYGTASVIQPGGITPTVAPAGTQKVAVTNTTPYDLEGWGVTAGGISTAGRGSLPAGASAEIDLGAGFSANPVEAIMSQARGPISDRWWQVYAPLSSVASRLAGSQYFFGFVGNLPLTISVDGNHQSIAGPGLILVPLTDLDSGGASPEILEADGNFFEDGGWFEGNSIVLQYHVAGRDQLRLVRGEQPWGAPASYQAWDWTREQFTDIAPGDLAPDFVNGDGEVVIRIASSNESEVFGVIVTSVRILWESGS